MRLRPDLLDAKSPHGIEIIQLTADPDVPSSHLYMEAQIFTPDSMRFLLHRSAHAPAGDGNLTGARRVPSRRWPFPAPRRVYRTF